MTSPEQDGRLYQRHFSFICIHSHRSWSERLERSGNDMVTAYTFIPQPVTRSLNAAEHTCWNTHLYELECMTNRKWGWGEADGHDAGRCRDKPRPPSLTCRTGSPAPLLHVQPYSNWCHFVQVGSATAVRAATSCFLFHAVVACRSQHWRFLKATSATAYIILQTETAAKSIEDVYFYLTGKAWSCRFDFLLSTIMHTFIPSCIYLWKSSQVWLNIWIVLKSCQWHQMLKNPSKSTTSVLLLIY